MFGFVTDWKQCCYCYYLDSKGRQQFGVHQDQVISYGSITWNNHCMAYSNNNDIVTKTCKATLELLLQD